MLIQPIFLNAQRIDRVASCIVKQSFYDIILYDTLVQHDSTTRNFDMKTLLKSNSSRLILLIYWNLINLSEDLSSKSIFGMYIIHGLNNSIFIGYSPRAEA